MDIKECIAILTARGYIVESDDRIGREDWWLVFDPHCPQEISNGGWPNFFSAPDLVQWVERYL